MKIQIESDLHFEFGRDVDSTLKNAGADTLVLAGDIVNLVNGPTLEEVFAVAADRWDHVVYTPGNHEFYKTSIKKGWEQIYKAQKPFLNVWILANNPATVRGVWFYGGTGWYPDRQADPIAWDARKFMADTRLIKDLHQDSASSNAAFIENLYRLNANTGRWPDVIVSHHLPVEECVAAPYKGAALNAYFVSDFPVRDIGSKLWIHGHTHSKVDVVVDGTRIVANPTGYPGERPPPTPVVIEV